MTAYGTGPRAAALGAVSEDEAAAIVLEDLRSLFPKAAPKLIACRLEKAKASWRPATG